MSERPLDFISRLLFRDALNEARLDRQLRRCGANASRAIGSGAPSTSNMMRPGNAHDQNSGAPRPCAPRSASSTLARPEHTDPHAASALHVRVSARRAASIDAR
jgi:hypothetical protein